MIYFIKQVPLYPRKLLVVITKDFRESGKKWNIKFSDSDLDAKGLAFKSYLGKYKAVTIFIHPEYIDNWGVWAHESLHIVNYIMDSVGIPADNNNDEAHTYLLSWVMETIQSFLKKEEAKIIK